MAGHYSVFRAQPAFTVPKPSKTRRVGKVSSGTRRSRASGSYRPRLQWDDDMVDLVVSRVKELVRNGHRTEAMRFKVDHLRRIAREVSNISGKEVDEKHISNKIDALKKTWFLYLEHCSHVDGWSGDPPRSSEPVEDAHYEAYPLCRPFRYVQPHYASECKSMFGESLPPLGRYALTAAQAAESTDSSDMDGNDSEGSDGGEPSGPAPLPAPQSSNVNGLARDRPVSPPFVAPPAHSRRLNDVQPIQSRRVHDSRTVQSKRRKENKYEYLAQTLDYFADRLLAHESTRAMSLSARAQAVNRVSRFKPFTLLPRHTRMAMYHVLRDQATAEVVLGVPEVDLLDYLQMEISAHLNEEAPNGHLHTRFSPLPLEGIHSYSQFNGDSQESHTLRELAQQAG